jgi:hypothetical protein
MIASGSGTCFTKTKISMIASENLQRTEVKGERLNISFLLR